MTAAQTAPLALGEDHPARRAKGETSSKEIRLLLAITGIRGARQMREKIFRFIRT